jgi:hypothetical protein
MSVITQFCLAFGAVTPERFEYVATNLDLGFEPTRVFTRSGPQQGISWQEAIDGRGNGLRDWMRVEGPGDAALALGGIAGRTCDQIVWQTEDAPTGDGMIAAITRLPGFTAAYMGDADDVFWQSETSIDTYERLGRSHAGLPRHPFDGGFPWETEQIDVSQNPGRRTPLNGIWLWAAARMWFAAPAFFYLDRERLAKLPVGTVQEETNGLLAVELFPMNWFSSRLDEVRQRQALFREWTGFDRLESNASKIESEVHDAVIEIEDPGCGLGSRRIIEWLDVTERRGVPRSRAARRRVWDLGPTGEVLSEEVRDA